MKLIVDNMLGRSAKYLRMLGYDTIYPAPEDDAELIKLANTENRIIITRSQQLYRLQYDKTQVVLISSNNFTDNFRRIIDKLNLRLEEAQLFSRCLECNTPVESVDKSSVKEQLPQKVKEHFNNFTRCPYCGKIYWKGGHTRRMIQRARLLFDKDQ